MTSPADPEVMATLRERLQRDAAAGKLEGLDLGNLEQAMALPKASDTVAEILRLDAASVSAGELAPDFRLPYLSQPDGEAVALSRHRGQQPVGLVFGSYT